MVTCELMWTGVSWFLRDDPDVSVLLRDSSGIVLLMWLRFLASTMYSYGCDSVQSFLSKLLSTLILTLVLSLTLTLIMTLPTQLQRVDACMQIRISTGSHAERSKDAF